MDWTYIIVSVISGIIGASFPTILFFKVNRKKKIEEAKSLEIANDKEYIQIYKDLVKEYQLLVCYKNNCKERII